MKTETIVYLVIGGISGISLIVMMIKGLMGPGYTGTNGDNEPIPWKEFVCLVIVLITHGCAARSHFKDKPRVPCGCEVPTSTQVEGNDNLLRDVVRDRMLPNPNPMSRGRVANRILKGFAGSDD